MNLRAAGGKASADLFNLHWSEGFISWDDAQE
jgi:hypothetical protein